MATRISLNSNFQANYTQKISHLKENCTERIQRCIQNILCVVFPLLGMLKILVKSFSLLQGVRKIPKEIRNKETRSFKDYWKKQSTYTLQNFTLVTPDKAIIKGTYFKNKKLDTKSDTLIFFNPDDDISIRMIQEIQKGKHIKRSTFLDIIEQTQNCHFVTFDYRGSGESSGNAWNAIDLELDGETAYQYVKDHLGVPENKIHMYGYSLGGGVSAQVKKNHPECTGVYISDRSFTSLAKVPQEFMQRHLIDNKIVNCFVQKIIQFFRWDMQTDKIWDKIQGRKYVIYHPEDFVIGNENLSSMITTETINLQDYNYVEGFYPNHHCLLLQNYDTNLPQKIIGFIFP